jgi:aspartate kinase
VALVVQKYGGSSVKDRDHVHRVADRIIETAKQGNKVVVVVSAMGKHTDQLIALFNEIVDNSFDLDIEREMDNVLVTGEMISSSILAAVIKSKGHEAINFMGHQIGLLTTEVHTRAQLVSMSAEGKKRVFKYLDRGYIVIVAGFQGVTRNGDLTTLGRGGSDTSAVALAGELGADICQIYTDVAGISNADPRMFMDPRKEDSKHLDISPEDFECLFKGYKARQLDRVSYEEMMELAVLGSKVLEPRSVRLGKRYGLIIEVKHSQKDLTGSQVIPNDLYSAEELSRPVIGLAGNNNEVKFSLTNLPNTPGVAAAIFDWLAGRGVVVDMIIQNVSIKSQRADISFTVPQKEHWKYLTESSFPKEIKELLKQFEPKGATPPDSYQVEITRDVAKVSIVGSGMKEQPGIAARIFRALGNEGINIHMITTSDIKVSCLIKESEYYRALSVIGKEFDIFERQ